MTTAVPLASPARYQSVDADRSGTQKTSWDFQPEGFAIVTKRVAIFNGLSICPPATARIGVKHSFKPGGFRRTREMEMKMPCWRSESRRRACACIRRMQWCITALETGGEQFFTGSCDAERVNWRRSATGCTR